ncbi:MAG TPA: zinc finger domain-containing protein, partial [Spirochaetota bacterium]|nr:zinc finger domain-containing protein [Spirochaetota bacterium]
ADEVWKFTGHDDSVHEQTYYDVNEAFNNPEIEKKMESLVDIKKDLLKALELKRKDKEIGTSIDSSVFIYVKDENLRKSLNASPEDVRRFFQVSKVTVTDTPVEGMATYDVSSVKVEKATGKKCVRCWNYYDSLGKDPNHPELCDRCTDAVHTVEKQGANA